MGGMAAPSPRHLWVLFLAPLFASAHAVAAPDPVDGVAIARGLGFDAAALRRVMDGELVARRSQETSDKELALVVWGWTRRPVGLLFERLNADEVLRVDRTVRSYGEIDVDDLERSFHALELPASLVDELGSTTRRGPLHLSHEELRAISRARESGAEAVGQAYRQALAQRVAAYAEGDSRRSPPTRGGAARRSPARSSAPPPRATASSAIRCPTSTTRGPSFRVGRIRPGS